MRSIRFWRRCFQFSVLLLFCILPWLNARGFHEVKGSLFAFDAFGVPFSDPASAAQAIVSGGINGAWPLAAFYLGALAALMIAFFCGRLFCGWICPYGLFSELAHNLRNKINSSFTRKSAKVIFWSKAALTLLAIAFAAALVYPAITVLSMPGQISLVPYMALTGAEYGVLYSLLVIPVAALGFEFITGKRLWCEYICPQSVFLGLSAWALPKILPGLRVGWNAEKCVCGKESPCQRVCSIGVNPRRKGGPSRRDCILCGDCVDACKKRGKALSYKICSQLRSDIKERK